MVCLSASQHRATPTARLGGAILAVVLLAGSCGDDGAVTTTTTITGTGTASSTTEADSPEPAAPSSATAPETSSTSTSGSASTTLPGEPIFSYPSEGDTVAAMGVAYDDVLNVRVTPGVDADVVATMVATGDGAVATGRARKLTKSIWYEVMVDDRTGWANSSYLGFMASTDDATAEFLDGGQPPEAETMEALGELVARRFAPDDPEPGLRIVQSGAATLGDPAEIGFDVIGVGDDSVAGFRLQIFATPAGDGRGFVLRSIERTTFCWRGVADGLCV